MGGDHGGEAHDEAEREVDAARDDHEGLAGGEQERRHREDGDGLDVEGIEDERTAEGCARPDLEPDDQCGEKEPGAQVGDALDERLGDFGVVGLGSGVAPAGSGIGCVRHRAIPSATKPSRAFARKLDGDGVEAPPGEAGGSR